MALRLDGLRGAATRRFARSAVLRRTQPRAERLDLFCQCSGTGGVCLSASAYHDIECALRPRETPQKMLTGQLPKATLESIAGDGGVAMLGDHDPDPRDTTRGSNPTDLEMRSPQSLPLANDLL